MPLPTDLTYNELKNTVTNWIKTNCMNISNYGAISSAVKSGYQYTIGTFGGGAYTEKATAIISSPLNEPTSASQVDIDMNEFWTIIGSPSGYISPYTFYPFINNMVSFCCTKIAYIYSQPNKSGNSLKYLIYYPQNKTWKFYTPIVESEYRLIDASDTDTFWKNLIEMVSRKEGYIRVLTTQYRFTLS